MMTRPIGRRRTVSLSSVAAAAAATAAAAALSAVPVAEAAAAECSGSLKCRHGTECVDGPSVYSSALHDGFPHLPFLLAPSEVDGEHCACPADRVGVDCGTKIASCNDDTRFPCLNNGRCVGDEVCDCEGAHKDGRTMFAGSHCEFEATNVCETKDDGLETESWFCANGGVCRHNESDINKKCNCSGKWMGPHCEFPKQTGSSSDGKLNGDAKHKSKRPEDCTLACENGGQCKFGAKRHGDKHKSVTDITTLSFLNDKEIGGMHCICPEGYAGVSCEVRVAKCGDHHCYHGADCISEGDGWHCDCNTAGLGNGDGGEQKKYAGRICEHAATSICEMLEKVESETGGMFCTNGGQCNKDEPHKGCDCSGTGHTGPLCEYASGTEPECTLTCKNGGQCRHGINPNVSSILGTKFDLMALETHSSGFMHCSCPDGFLGADCGVKYEICGPKEEIKHVCANEGKCIVTGQNKHGKNKYGCNCGEMNPFAGAHCEHAATEFCTESHEDKEGKVSYHSFCANGGKCKETVSPTDGHPGCLCTADWEGDHCQYKFGTAPAKEISGARSYPQEGSGRRHKTLLAVFVFVSVASVVMIVAIFSYGPVQRLAHRNGGDTARSGGSSAEANDVNLAPKANLQMHDVEII